MTAHTKLTTKGQVVIPKDVRTRMGWGPGTDLEVTEAAGGVMLRPAAESMQRITLAEFRRRVPPYKGRPRTIEEISSVPEDALRKHYHREFKVKAD